MQASSRAAIAVCNPSPLRQTLWEGEAERPATASARAPGTAVTAPAPFTVGGHYLISSDVMITRRSTVTKSPNNEHRAMQGEGKAPRRKPGVTQVNRTGIEDPAVRQVPRSKGVHTSKQNVYTIKCPHSSQGGLLEKKKLVTNILIVGGLGLRGSDSSIPRNQEHRADRASSYQIVITSRNNWCSLPTTLRCSVHLSQCSQSDTWLLSSFILWLTIWFTLNITGSGIS